MRIDQHQLAFALLGGMAGYTLVRGLLNIIFGDPLQTIVLTFIVSAIFGVATWLYWRGWEGARFFATAGVALVVAFGLPLSQESLVLFTPLAFAVAITNTQWVAGVGLAMLVVLLGRDIADGVFDSVYASLAVGASYLVQVIAFAAARFALDTARIEAERNAAQAQAAKAEIEARATAIEQQRRELAEQNQRQQELLELVSQLETPAVRIAEGCCWRRWWAGSIAGGQAGSLAGYSNWSMNGG